MKESLTLTLCGFQPFSTILCCPLRHRMNPMQQRGASAKHRTGGEQHGLPKAGCEGHALHQATPRRGSDTSASREGEGNHQGGEGQAEQIMKESQLRSGWVAHQNGRQRK